MLKQIRKKNETTSKKLENLLKKIESSKVDLETNAFSLYTFVEDFKLSKLKMFIDFLRVF